MNEEKAINKPQKSLRKGFTTGSCAAAAANAATWLLLTGERKDVVELTTPNGTILKLTIKGYESGEKWAQACIVKDSGDDPDVTNGVLVYTKLEYTREQGLVIEGGIGIGRVTKSGLACGIGEAAINPVPKAMIINEVTKVFDEVGLKVGAKVTVSIPEGEKLAKKTYNPRLGILGGISVLGTSGIVEPMSEHALLQTIRLDMKVQKENGSKILIMSPGNYGADYLKNKTNVDLSKAVKCSNFIGDALDFALELEIRKVLLVGHIGKLVKLAGGIMNTHSRNADCRMELLTAYAGISGASSTEQQQIMDCITTDKAMEIIKQAGLLKKVMEKLIKRMEYYLSIRTNGLVKTEVIVFSTQLGFLGQSAGAEEFLLESF